MKHKRMTMLLMLSLAILMALPMPALAAGEQMEADRGLNVRSGPGTKYEVVGALNKGDVVTVLDRSGNWTQIRYAAGSTGYAYSAYLDPYTGSGPIQTGTSFEGTHTATANVNVRAGAGTKYAKLGSLKKGELVTAVGVSGSWTKIQWYEGAAYVSSAYLKENPTAEKKNYDNLYFTLKDCTLRTSESRSSREIGGFPKDYWLRDAVKVTKKGWLHLRFEVLDGENIRIQNAYVAPGEFGKLPKGFTVTSGARYVREDKANMYRDAQDDRYPNQWLAKDSMVTLLAKKGDWVLVDYGSGNEISLGYMKAAALSNA